MSEGFFTGEAIEDALVFVQDGEPNPQDMRVVAIVLEFKRAAD